MTGTVEIRSTAAHGSPLPVKAKWLSVELEKIEVVPPSPLAESAPADLRKKKGGRRHGAGTGPESEGDAKFVELIGTGPSKLWDAVATGTATSTGTADAAPGSSPLRPVISISTTARGYVRSSRHGGNNLKAKLAGSFRLRNVFRPGSSSRFNEDDMDDEEEEGDGLVDGEGYATIPDGSYPFSIPLPEGLPPTVELSGAGRARGGSAGERGIAYQIVASLALKPKRCGAPLSSNSPRPSV